MILGIDLGTTNSLSAVFRDGKVELIPNRLGSTLTPSVVSIDEKGTVYTGETALERKSTDPLNTAAVFKRSMGTDKKFFLQGKPYKAEELSAILLKSLKEDAEAYLGEAVEEAVISVPAYFNDRQRKATKKAGELAGFKVERIINEPTAAAVAYGIDSDSEESRYLVFDLGGGTLDVSILELDDMIMEVRAVAGDNFLGGEDFTDVLFRMFMNKMDLEESELPVKTLTHIRRQAEKAKKEFSKADRVSMSAIINDEIKQTSFSLKEYEVGCTLLFERIKKPIEKALRDSRIKLTDIDEVVLVGGGTKLPLIRRFAGRLMGRPAKVGINPDEAIVTGVAIQAAMKERNKDIREIVLTDVCPYSLGTEVAHTTYGNNIEGGYFDPIIERNTVVPASKSRTYYTVSDGQRKVRVPVLQGENRLASENLLLGAIEMSVPPKPAGEESITIRFTYNINSILEVIVKVDSTGLEKKMVIQSDGSIFTAEEAEKLMAKLNHIKVHPRDKDENKVLILKAERMYQEALGDLRPMINHALMAFEDVLERQVEEDIAAARKDFTYTLSQLETLLADQMKFDMYMDEDDDEY